MKKLLLLALIWGTAIFSWRFLADIYSADLLYEKSQNYLAKGDVELAKKLIDKALEKNGNEPNYYRGRAKVLIVAAGYTNTILDNVSKEKILKDLEKAVSLNPNNLVTLRNCLQLYYFLAIKDINLPAGSDNIDEKYLLIAQNYFQGIKKKYSHDVGVIATIAKYEKKLGDIAGYNESVEIVKNLRPDLLDWYESFR